MTAANDNHPTYIIHGAMDGCVLTDARGRIVFGPTTASIVARKRAELEAAS